jgi:hypothetical protein
MVNKLYSKFATQIVKKNLKNKLFILKILQKLDH